MGWLRWIVYALAALVVVGAAAYYWYFVDASAPQAAYSIDMAAVRKEAASLPGDKVKEIRFEHVYSFNFPFTVMVAGEGWANTEVPVLSYQLVYPTGTLIIDTGIAKSAVGKDKTFVADAYDRMEKAMESASWIVITHEHPDHIGGLVDHPNLAMVMTHTKLSREQMDHPEKMFGLKWPAGIIENQEALDYDKVHAVAPGVVLIKAPGHTPGSQLVFVQRADGKEFLFVGDVAWRMENIDLKRPRSRFVSDFFLGEDRGAVVAELAELKRIHDAEPNLVIVPGHDIKHLAELVKAGDLIQGFKTEPTP